MFELKITPAKVEDFKLRICIDGPGGSGKSYTALAVIARLMNWKVAAIDTERNKLSLYSSIHPFQKIDLPDHNPDYYMQAIKMVEDMGFDCLIIDSLSHIWMGEGGFLEIADTEAARSQSKNSFMAWRNVTPRFNQFINRLLAANLHVIATLRVKTDWVIQSDERGKLSPKKVGLAPVQRDGLEYEFDVIGSMTPDHDMIITKARQLPGVNLDGRIFKHPGQEFVDELKKLIGLDKNPPAQPKLIPVPSVVPPPPKVDPTQDELPFEPDPPAPVAPPPPPKKAKAAPKAKPGVTSTETPEPAEKPPAPAAAPKTKPESAETKEARALAITSLARRHGWTRPALIKLMEDLQMPASTRELTEFQADVLSMEIENADNIKKYITDAYET